MISRRNNLKPLLESSSGIHLTMYLVNHGSLANLKVQLQECLDEASVWLDPVLTAEEKNKFFEPLDSILLDARIFNQMKGNIGIFRNQNYFRVLNIPVPVEQSCQVATSFHVKPLLRWIQSDQEFLVLGVEQGYAHMYLGSQNSCNHIDSIVFPAKFEKQKTNANLESFKWLNDWIFELTKTSQAKLFLVGESESIKRIKNAIAYKNILLHPNHGSFEKKNLKEICSIIRKVLKEEANLTLEKTLLEFRIAESNNWTKKNIFQIAKAVVDGKVRKLIVTDELNIFGKIDRQSGGLAIHPIDLDHEDDDILDDLAQMVLSQGGEVIVASRNQIPKGRPILAILDDQGQALAKAEEVRLSQILQERYG